MEPLESGQIADVQKADPTNATLGDRIARYCERFELPLLIAILAAVAIRSVLGSKEKPFWFDEIYTVVVALRPTWHEFFGAIPVNGMPPLYCLLVRLFAHVFGASELSARAPAILAFVATLSGVYVFVRRECGVLFGFASVALTLAQPGWVYSYEARPYSMLLAFVMLGLVSWQSAMVAGNFTPPRPRRLALTGLCLAIAGALFSHFIGTIEIGIPLLAGELARTWRRRKWDWPVLATALVALPVVAITAPMARRTHDLLLRYSHAARSHLSLAHWISTALREVEESLWRVLGKDVFWTLLIFILVVLPASGFIRRMKGRRTDSPRTTERDRLVPEDHFYEMVAAAVGTTLLIPITAVFMELTSGWYSSRYGIATMAGIPILACLVLRRYWHRQQHLLALALTLLFGLPWLGDLVSQMSHFKPTHPENNALYSVAKTEPVVVGDPFYFVPVWWYAPADLKDRFIYMPSPEGNMIVEVSVMAGHSVMNTHLENFESFTSAHDAFLAQLGASEGPSLEQRLERAGFALTNTDVEGIPGLRWAARKRP